MLGRLWCIIYTRVLSGRGASECVHACWGVLHLAVTLLGFQGPMLPTGIREQNVSRVLPFHQLLNSLSVCQLLRFCCGLSASIPQNHKLPQVHIITLTKYLSNDEQHSDIFSKFVYLAPQKKQLQKLYDRWK